MMRWMIIHIFGKARLSHCTLFGSNSSNDGSDSGSGREVEEIDERV